MWATDYRHTCSTNHFQTFCWKYPHIDYASVDLVMTPVILATLKIPIWFYLIWRIYLPLYSAPLSDVDLSSVDETAVEQRQTSSRRSTVSTSRALTVTRHWRRIRRTFGQYSGWFNTDQTVDTALAQWSNAHVDLTAVQPCITHTTASFGVAVHLCVVSSTCAELISKWYNELQERYRGFPRCVWYRTAQRATPRYLSCNLLYLLLISSAHGDETAHKWTSSPNEVVMLRAENFRRLIIALDLQRLVHSTNSSC